MTVRSMRAAEVGWSIFRASEPRPTLDVVNEQLAVRALPPVSTRMYDHYHRLARHGFDNYMPINELDMTVKARRLGRASWGPRVQIRRVREGVMDMVNKKDSHPAVRDSRTGRFVEPKEAQRRPSTTETERIPNPGKGDNRRK